MKKRSNLFLVCQLIQNSATLPIHKEKAESGKLDQSKVYDTLADSTKLSPKARFRLLISGRATSQVALSFCLQICLQNSSTRLSPGSSSKTRNLTLAYTRPTIFEKEDIC